MQNQKNEAKKVEIPQKLQHKNIHAALSAFQGDLTTMERKGEVTFKTKTGQEVKFKYTPLGDIMEVIYPLLQKHGLAVRHEISPAGIEAILTHETFKDAQPILVTERGKAENVEPGGVIMLDAVTVQKFETNVENEIRSGVVKINQAGEMKDLGAAITYARRYTLTMLCGIASEEDKDATLLEDRAKNAMAFAFTRAKQGIENAKDETELNKATAVLQKDMEKLQQGKAGALGLSKEEYEDLMSIADERRVALTGQTIE